MSRSAINYIYIIIYITWIWIWIWTHTHTRTHTHIYIYIYTHTYIYILLMPCSASCGCMGIDVATIPSKQRQIPGTWIVWWSVAMIVQNVPIAFRNVVVCGCFCVQEQYHGRWRVAFCRLHSSVSATVGQKLVGDLIFSFFLPEGTFFLAFYCSCFLFCLISKTYVFWSSSNQEGWSPSRWSTADLGATRIWIHLTTLTEHATSRKDIWGSFLPRQWVSMLGGGSPILTSFSFLGKLSWAKDIHQTRTSPGPSWPLLMSSLKRVNASTLLCYYSVTCAPPW